jgi:hypothetical protein
MTGVLIALLGAFMTTTATKLDPLGKQLWESLCKSKPASSRLQVES